MAAAAGIGAVGSIVGGITAGKAAKHAADKQYQASQDALRQQQGEFDTTQANIKPFVSAGQGAIGQQGNILGLNGAPAQQTALDALKASPYYQSIYRNGEEAVLQNASATGGLRGGNTERSLADFGADSFAQTIQNMLGNLGGVSSLGAGAASGLGQLGQANSSAVSSLMQGGAAAQAGGILGQSGAMNTGINNAISSLAPLLSHIGSHGGMPSGVSNAEAADWLGF